MRHLNMLILCRLFLSMRLTEKNRGLEKSRKQENKLSKQRKDRLVR